MSAEIDIEIAIEKVKDFFSARQRSFDKINSEYRKSIDSIKRDIDQLDDISNIRSQYKEKIIKKIELQMKQLEEMNRVHEFNEYINFLEDLKQTDDYSEIENIYEKASNQFDDILFEEEMKYEKLPEQELCTEYVVTKLKELGQNVIVDEDGTIFSVAKDKEKEKEIIVTVEKDNIKVDIPGSAKKCVLTILEFEKAIENEMTEEKNKSWHTPAREKEIKNKKKRLKENFNIQQIYNQELLEKEK